MPRTPAMPLGGRSMVRDGDPTCAGKVRVRVTSCDGSIIIAGRSLTMA